MVIDSFVSMQSFHRPDFVQLDFHHVKVEIIPMVVALHFVVKHFALPSSAGRIRRDIKEMSVI